jgi:hypothetical protein
MYVEAMTFDDLSQQPGFPALLGEYAEECAVDSLPVNLDPARIISAYGPLADCGLLHMFGAFISEDDGVSGSYRLPIHDSRFPPQIRLHRRRHRKFLCGGHSSQNRGWVTTSTRR